MMDLRKLMNSESNYSKEKASYPRFALLMILCLLLVFMTACGDDQGDAGSPVGEPVEESSTVSDATEAEENDQEESAMKELKMEISGAEVAVSWEDNESVAALRELAPVTVEMSMYGDFEQVGSLGSKLPRNDKQTTTKAGDIVLYSGSQIVVFYGSNSWAYTRLGRIEGLTVGELTDLLSNGDVTLKIYTE